MMDEDLIDPESAGAKVSIAWTAFVHRLEAVLALMQEDQYLIILVKQSNRFVQFAAQGAYGLRVETTSNHFLSKRERLGQAQIRDLVAMGWGDPTGGPSASTPELDPDGSPNFFREFDDPVDFGRVAEFSVRALVEVIRVPHPAYLEYEAFDSSGKRLQFESLRMREADRPESHDEAEQIQDVLILALLKATGVADLAPDDDGDIGVRIGSAAIFATVNPGGLSVRFRSPLLVDVTASARLFARLNDLNVAEDSMRFVFQNGVVHAIEDVCVKLSRPDLLIDAFRRFGSVVESLDGLLREEFGGDTVFPEQAAGMVKH